MSGPIRRILVEGAVRNTAFTRELLERAGGDIEVDHVVDAREVEVENLEEAKRTLALIAPRGEAIKPCPGTPEYLCCGYQILNVATGCPIDCSYCILQGYFSNAIMTVQADPDAFLAQADARLANEPGRVWRLGTGEFADSLALDPLTGYAARLVEWVREKPQAVLELKTKAPYVDALLDLDHGGRTVCAWSLNPPELVAAEERGAASLEARLRAARRCQDAGYRLAFHFDPILPLGDWEAAYHDTIRCLFDTIDADRVAWISLGCFRYTPGLERTIRRRRPESPAPYGEFVRAGDGKMRYPQPLRIHVYERLVRWLREAGGEGPVIYFCMENPRVWQSVMGEAPGEDADLAARLDAAVGLRP